MFLCIPFGDGDGGNLHQEFGGNERSDLHHRCSRPSSCEGLAMCVANCLPVRGVGKIDAGLYYILQTAAELLQSSANPLDDNFCLPTWVTGMESWIHRGCLPSCLRRKRCCRCARLANSR